MEEASPVIGYLAVVFLFLPILKGMLHYRAVHCRISDSETRREFAPGSVPECLNSAPAARPGLEELAGMSSR